RAPRKELIKKFSHIKKEDGLLVALNGAGDYHHLTYGFCRGIIDSDEEEYSVFLADLHGDCNRNTGMLECGNHISMLLKDSKSAKKGIIIGANTMVHSSRWMDSEVFKNGIEIYPYSKSRGCFRDVKKEPDVDCVDCEYYPNSENFTVEWHTVNKEGIEKITDRALERTETDDVYLTIDLDVLKKEYAATNWGNGNMDLRELLDSIRIIKNEKNVIGLDITGTDGTAEAEHNLYTTAAIVNEITDGPYEREFFFGEISQKYKEYMSDVLYSHLPEYLKRIFPLNQII
ncbi:MAG: arginase family protein, partial [Candidatus Aenigmarchaeota archaeon]|nr:arginase family protein [Candidatus Aenigmarchaeota archaeon]